YDVNTNLLDALASKNRGVSDYIEPIEDIEVKVSNFFAKVNHPVLSNLSLDLGGVEADLMYPRALPDLFKGSQLTIVGRYKNSANATTIRLNGKIGSREETFTFTGQSFPGERSANQFLPRLWATRRVGYLLEQIKLNGTNRELTDEIIALGTRFGIVTPYTSFLVTEDFKEMSRRGAAYHPGAMPGFVNVAPSASGEGAVRMSQAEKSMKQLDRVAAPDDYMDNIRTVGTKTFTLKDEVWIDTEFRESARLPEVEVKFGTDEFFKLIADEPKLAEFFALGQKVVVVFGNKVYRVR
ncbi:MAG TPA: hypothetical protein VG778_06575, partial [Blastocatellia bacterium]|nr:hypothetical protein [Blastocatellia bacterium]